MFWEGRAGGSGGQITTIDHSDTLIYGGRNRRVMIRRELPRTKSAGWAVRPYRIERTRILLFVCPSAAICSAFVFTGFVFFAVSGGLHLLPGTFGSHRNVPDETE